MIITQINSLIISLTFKVWLKTQYTGKKWWTLLLKEPEMHKMIKESAFVGPPVPSYDRYSIMLGHKLPTALFMINKRSVDRLSIGEDIDYRFGVQGHHCGAEKSRVWNQLYHRMRVTRCSSEPSAKNPQYKQHVVCLERFLSQI